MQFILDHWLEIVVILAMLHLYKKVYYSEMQVKRNLELKHEIIFNHYEELKNMREENKRFVRQLYEYLNVQEFKKEGLEKRK